MHRRHPRWLGRWELRREISGHEDGCVLDTLDHARGGTRRVLKVFRAPDAGRLESARREFSALRHVRHEHVARAHDFGRVETRDPAIRESLGSEFPLLTKLLARARPSEELAWLTSEPFDGLSLRDAFLSLFPEGAGADARVRDSLRDAPRRWHVWLRGVAKILCGLEAVHACGLVHFDLKPSNLLLAPQRRGSDGESTPADFDAKIIDFGLCELETTPIGTRARGTVPFIAPEILSTGRSDRRSDIFSLGVSIAWSTSGRPPFAGDTPLEWMEAAQRGKAHLLKAPFAQAPKGLDRWIESLLQPRPEDRPESAAECLESLREIANIGADISPLATETAVPSTGLRDEMASLKNELEQLGRGETQAASYLVRTTPQHFVGALLRDIEDVALSQGAQVFVGRSERPSPLAYQPIAEVLLAMDAAHGFEAADFAPFADVISRLRPPQESDATSSSTDARADRETSIQAADVSRLQHRLCDLLLECGRRRPTVIALRDLHLADEETLAVVHGVSRRLALERDTDDEPTRTLFRPSRLFLVVTCELGAEPSDEANARLREIAESPFFRCVEPGPLGPEESREWLERLFGPGRAPSSALTRISELSGGRPRMLHALGQLSRRNLERPADDSADRWLARLPERFEEAIDAQIESLPPSARRTLEVLSAAGQAALSSRVLEATVSSLARTPVDLTSTLAPLERAGLVESSRDPDGLTIACSDETLRRRVYRAIRREDREHIHEMLLAQLEAHVPIHAFHVGSNLPWHAARARQDERRVQLALAAAARSARALSVATATTEWEGLLDSPSALTSLSTPSRRDGEAIRREIHWRLVEAYRARRIPTKALDSLTFLLATADTSACPLQEAEVHLQMGEVYEETGENANAAYFFEKAIGIARDAVASGVAGANESLARALLAEGRHLLRREAYELVPSRLDEALEKARAADSRGLEARVLLAIAELHHERHEPSRSLTAAQGSLLASERARDTRTTLESIRFAGGALTARGDHEKAIELFRDGLERARAGGWKEHEALALSSLGTVHHNRGDAARALQFYRESLRISREIDDRKGIAGSFNNLGNGYRSRDQNARAETSYRRAIELFSELGDQVALATCMNNISSVLEDEGRYADALEYAHRAIQMRRGVASRAGLAFSYYRIGRIYLSKGELEKSLKYAERSLQIREELEERMQMAYSHLQLAEIHLRQGRLAGALQRCQQAAHAFERFENAIGLLLARLIEVRLLAEVGRTDDARSLLSDVLRKARAEGREAIERVATFEAGLLASREGKLEEAESGLREAERAFRQSRGRRRVIETLLALGELATTGGDPARAMRSLEEAYSLLEELGIRDLVPHYFLLRARLEARDPNCEPETIHKLLQRGLVEARETDQAELLWKLHLESARLATRVQDRRLTRTHLREATRLLDSIHDSLPLRYREHFWSQPERAAVRGALTIAAEDRESSAAGPVIRPVQGDSSAVRTHELSRLHEIVRARTAGDNLETLLERIVDAVIDLLGAERGFLILTSDRLPEQTITVARNFDQEEVSDPGGKLSRTVAQGVISSGQPALSGNAFGDRALSAARSIRELRLRSILCVPLTLGPQVLGALYVDNRHRRDAFDESDLKTLQTFSDQAAIAIATARLLAQPGTGKENVASLPATRPPKTAGAPAVETGEAREEGVLGMIGRSETMEAIFTMLPRWGVASAPLLISGESGTGKGLVARAVHRSGPRRDGPLVEVNCAALPESLIESELFGHEAGAFTGASSSKTGLLASAHGGTLLLDEIADLSLEGQTKLLRFLEDGEVRPVGSKSGSHADVRVIATTKSRAQDLVREGRLREDLLYRLNVLTLEIPPLRERKEDIPPLLESFVRRAARDLRQRAPRFSAPAIERILAHDWPGNVRELKHFVERTLVVVTGDLVEASDLLLEPGSGRMGGRATATSVELVEGQSLREFRDARNRFEAEYVRFAVEWADGNVALAAKASGLSRESLYRLLRKHGVERN